MQHPALRETSLGEVRALCTGMHSKVDKASKQKDIEYKEAKRQDQTQALAATAESFLCDTTCLTKSLGLHDGLQLHFRWSRFLLR